MLDVCGLQNGESIMADAAAAVAGAASNLPPASYPLSSTANSFLAGVLDHLPGLLPFTAPSVNSYDRLKPCAWSGTGGEGGASACVCIRRVGLVCCRTLRMC